MISFIFQEHKEGRAFIKKMLDQVALVPATKEVIIPTSASEAQFKSEYRTLLGQYDYPIRVIGDINSCGAARDVGSQNANYKNLVYFDMHVCFTPATIARLMSTLIGYPDSLVGPAIRATNFPSCELDKIMGVGHGVAFSFRDDNPFTWEWLAQQHPEQEIEEFPCVCGCAMTMRKSTYDALVPYGGFMGLHTGLSLEEAVSMRLLRLGHTTVVDKNATVGHLYKGYEGKPGWDEHSIVDYYKGRVAGAYVNVFDPVLWNQISECCQKALGDDWGRHLAAAETEYGWLRQKLEPLRDKIDERWFFRF